MVPCLLAHVQRRPPFVMSTCKSGAVCCVLCAPMSCTLQGLSYHSTACRPSVTHVRKTGFTQGALFARICKEATCPREVDM